MALKLNKTNNPLMDDLGRFRTTSLFWEYRSEKYPYLWTLAEADVTKGKENIPSLHKIYMSYDHIPEHEYDFAIDMFSHWSHWLRLQESPEIMSYITKWREELVIKNKAREIKNLMMKSLAGDVAAAKYLADGKFEAPKRGRPSKEEITRERKLAARAAEEHESDKARVLSMMGRKGG